MLDKPESTGKVGGLKVIGAGFGRTGTLSLKVALEELGFGPCYHMTELFDKPEGFALWEAAARGETIDWEELFEGYQATVDWPSCTFYKELMSVYPDAKVLLTVRDPEKWYESVRSTIYKISRNVARIPFASLLPSLMGPFVPVGFRIGRLANTLVWEDTFGGSFEDKKYAIAVFNQHNERVKEQVPPDRLLVYNVKEGWEPLCRFLGVDVPPNKAFPYLNDRFTFAGNRVWQQQVRRLARVLAVTGAALAVLLILRLWLKRRAS